MLLNYVSLFLIFFAVLVIIVGIVVVHELPGKIAAKRHHPQIDAIKIMSYLGLIVFPLWMFALIWAYFRPWPIAGFEDQKASPFDTPAAASDSK
jgi:uncharacterized membrane protein